MSARDYQRDAINSCVQKWRGGAKRIVLVAPTGSGKSVLAKLIAQKAQEYGDKVGVIVHRQELVTQMRHHMDSVGVNAWVDTVQAMLASGRRRPADLVIFDESHHAVATEWQSVLDAYPDARVLGLTATPLRADGKPLDGLFEDMVIATNYSRLIHDGHLVGCQVFRAKSVYDGGLATDIVGAYKRYGQEGQAFCYCGTVDHAHRTAYDFNTAGVVAGVIEANTPKNERRDLIRRFKAGRVRVLTNVNTLTEGVDVPAASVCIIARTVGHCSTYLQMAGRVLRPSPGKEHAIMIDLVGACLAFGLPTEDRIYSLGAGIERDPSQPALRVCLECGYTFAGSCACPSCGYKMEQMERARQLVIYSAELEAVYAGIDTSQSAKDAELARLRAVAWDAEYGIGWVIKKYKELFGSEPSAEWTTTEKRREFSRLLKRFPNKRQSMAIYKNTVGEWPDWSWRSMLGGNR